MYPECFYTLYKQSHCRVLFGISVCPLMSRCLKECKIKINIHATFSKCQFKLSVPSRCRYATPFCRVSTLKHEGDIINNTIRNTYARCLFNYDFLQYTCFARFLIIQNLSISSSYLNRYLFNKYLINVHWLHCSPILSLVYVEKRLQSRKRITSFNIFYCYVNINREEGA